MAFSIERFLINSSSLCHQDRLASRRAMRRHRTQFPECAFCGSERELNVHHIVPIHKAPKRADDWRNLITLCDPSNNGCHRWLAHFGNFRRLYNPHIVEHSLLNRCFLREINPEKDFTITINDLEDFYSKAMEMTKNDFRKHYLSFANKIIHQIISESESESEKSSNAPPSPSSSSS